MNRLSFLSFLLNGVFGADTLFIIADIANVRKNPSRMPHYSQTQYQHSNRCEESKGD